MTVRPDNRLADVPMTPVDCGACGARVQVRKSSWEQTSVQWDGASRDRCDHRDDLALCPQLRASIEAAVHCGRLPVLEDGEPLDSSEDQPHAHRG